jgi:uncharacterized iron-regulated membrane protein
MKKKYSFRKFSNDIHLWLGIASGLVLFVVCLTGTILTFEKEIVEWADAERYHVEAPAGAAVVPIDQLVAKTEAGLKGKVTGIEMPANPNAVYRFTVQEKGAKDDKREAGGRGGNGVKGRAEGGAGAKGGKGGGGGGKTYLINPYNGDITGTTKTATAEFFSTMMGLHRWLLLQDSGGKIIVGAATIIFVFLVLSGLVLWWPLKLRNWKQGFQIKFSGNWKRINHDLHNTLGFYSFLVLLVMALTGLCWSFEWYKKGVSDVLGDEVFKQRREKPLPSDPLNAGVAGKPMLAALISTADQSFPYEGNYRLRFPADSAGSYVINKSRTGFFALTAADKIQFEQYTGAVLKIEKFSDKPFNEQVAGSVRSLHLGDIFGTFSKIIYFLACLFATSLPVTGTIIWINKLRKKNKKQGANRRRIQRLQQHQVTPIV